MSVQIKTSSGLVPVTSMGNQSITYAISRNESGEIVLASSTGITTKVIDKDTKYTFNEDNHVLTITGTDGTSKQIQLGGEITSETIVESLGYTPISIDDVPEVITESTVSQWGFTKNAGTYIKPTTGIPASDLASGVIPTSLPANGGNAATVNGHSVNIDVPSNAIFTDTTYDAIADITINNLFK